MTDPMAALDAAYARVQQAEKLAEEIVNAAWLNFGRAIRDAREQGTKQADIARHFGREPEHIRRLQEDADVADGLKEPPARKTRPVPQAPGSDLFTVFTTLNSRGVAAAIETLHRAVEEAATPPHSEDEHTD
ncbi:hypothetical protein [Nonomuraea sp. NPDC001023]|uniref:hypothetical protein n=1 Tax=unclassified Nonomuraea TaxID=2593643 RepID=UPI00331C3095